MTPDSQHPARNPRLTRRGIYILPNLFTTSALFAGFYAIVMAMNVWGGSVFQASSI